MTSLAVIVLVLLLLKLATQLWLEHLNRLSVVAHAGAVPHAFQGIVDDATYEKSTRYALANGRFHRIELLWDAAVLIALLFSGVLPAAWLQFERWFGSSMPAVAAFFFGVGWVLALTGLPLAWYDQFRLEQRFGFNTTTQRTWWLDRLKGLLLAAVLGYPLLLVILKLVEWTVHWWWLVGWGTVLVFQTLVTVFAPVLILPLFNKFTPLPEGTLRERLLRLAERTRFRAQSIQVMDGSKRSRHSNAFFTGFGRFRRIVLFDTLVQQLTEPELEAVLAHEIGHYRLKHIPRMLATSAVGSLAGFYGAYVLSNQGWFYRAFGFQPGFTAAALLLFGLLSGLFTFWLAPLLNMWSRRYEYQADAFAKGVMAGPDHLVGALRKLHEKNLGNLTPHPAYSAFYYSHPTLLERERALLGGG